MKHVFVETNWVVASRAPVHERMPAALELVERAQRGEIWLHLPSICIGEARHPIRSKYQPRTSADAIRKFLAWTALQQDSEITDAEVIRRALDRFETRVLAELDELPAELESIRKIPGVEVFALDEQMLSRSVELSSEDLNLKPTIRRYWLRSWSVPSNCATRAKRNSTFASWTEIYNRGTKRVLQSSHSQACTTGRASGCIKTFL